MLPPGHDTSLHCFVHDGLHGSLHTELHELTTVHGLVFLSHMDLVTAVYTGFRIVLSLQHGLLQFSLLHEGFSLQFGLLQFLLPHAGFLHFDFPQSGLLHHGLLHKHFMGFSFLHGLHTFPQSA